MGTASAEPDRYTGHPTRSCKVMVNEECEEAWEVPMIAPSTLVLGSIVGCRPRVKTLH